MVMFGREPKKPADIAPAAQKIHCTSAATAT